MSDLSEHAARNRAEWDGWAKDYVAAGERNWAAEEPSWGIWGIPESELGLFSTELDGIDAIELGCGTAYVSAWLARRGARPVAIDNSEAQLETARRLQGEHGLEFPLIHGNAEQVPCPDASFDLAISEYGASIWCDPYLWIPEAARLLRPGGRLVFLINHPILMLCVAEEADQPTGETLLRPYLGMHRFEWDDDDSVEFHLPHGELIGLLRRSGFEIEELIEYPVSEGAIPSHSLATSAWARRWPTEEVWKVRRT